MHHRGVIIVACAGWLAGSSAIGAQAARGWTLDARPQLILGGEQESTGVLETVVGATRLRDGSILVGDHGEQALRLYSATGALLRTFGRKGGGPGEITYLVRMFRCGDSLYTFDADNGYRLSVFTLDGRYVRASRFTGPGGQGPYQSACNAAGMFAHLGWENRRDMRPGAFRSLVPVWLSRADSGVVRLVDSIPGSERWGTTRDGKLTGTRPMPLGKQPVLGIGRSHLYVGSADRYTIQAFDLQGRPASALQRPGEGARVSRADVEALIAQEAAGRSAEIRDRIEKAYAEIELPQSLPAYTALVTDADDLVWVRAYARPGSPHANWTVFASNGRMVTEIRVPADLEIYEIGKDYVLGRYLSPDVGTPEVRLYRLVRGQVARP